jgi:hypothetical protein
MEKFFILRRKKFGRIGGERPLLFLNGQKSKGCSDFPIVGLKDFTSDQDYLEYG